MSGDVRRDRRGGRPLPLFSEVPLRRLRGDVPNLRAGVLVLRLLPLPILLKEVHDLLWHRYLLTVIDNNDVVVHLCPFRFQRKGTHPRCRYSAKNCRPSWSILRTGVVIMPYGAHECLRPRRGVDLTGKLRD